MRIIRATPLTFSAVDGLGFAAATGSLDAAHRSAPYAPHSLGPLLELIYVAANGQLPPPPDGAWTAKNGANQMIDALKDGRESWLDTDSHRTGFVRTVRSGLNGDAVLTKFLMEAKKAASEIARLPGTTPGQLVAAMAELKDNIDEHSDSPDTGVLAFRAARGVFEFVAADRGIGVLKSLRQSRKFSALPDHGKALELAITDGTSRFENDGGRGHGFRPIFLGLVNLYGSLRFRSGDYALLMDGTSPGPATAQVAQKPSIDGFFASIRCHAVPTFCEEELKW
jgi:hypothetical protein